MRFDLKHSVFPIIPLRPQGDGTSRVYCDPYEQGSAFFISKDGLFITARHVVGKWSTESYVVMAVHFGLKGKKDCRVLELERHEDLDVAVGLAEKPGPNGWPYPFTIGTSVIGNGSAILTFGYANTRVSPHRDAEGPIDLDDTLQLDMSPRRHAGHVIEHLDRGPLIPGPCYHVSCDPGGGISGGPLIRKRTSCVHGLFVMGLPADGPDCPAAGFALDLRAIVDTWPIAFLGGLTLREYAKEHPGRLSVR